VERVRDFGRRLDPAGGVPEGLDAYEQRFYAALADDFNTPAALAVVFEWIAAGNRRLDAGERFGAGALSGMLWTLGLEGLLEPDAEAPDADAERLLEERQAARAERDFERADAKRDELLALGWVVRDTPDGPQLVRKG
jgi:cysteinyl-tRNA synthetase